MSTTLKQSCIFPIIRERDIRGYGMCHRRHQTRWGRRQEQNGVAYCTKERGRELLCVEDESVTNKMKRTNAIAHSFPTQGNTYFFTYSSWKQRARVAWPEGCDSLTPCPTTGHLGYLQNSLSIRSPTSHHRGATSGLLSFTRFAFPLPRLPTSSKNDKRRTNSSALDLLLMLFTAHVIKRAWSSTPRQTLPTAFL